MPMSLQSFQHQLAGTPSPWHPASCTRWRPQNSTRTLTGLISRLLLHSSSENFRLQPPQIVSLSVYNTFDLPSRPPLKHLSQCGGWLGPLPPRGSKQGGAHRGAQWLLRLLPQEPGSRPQPLRGWRRRGVAVVQVTDIQ